ncbi:immunoglobulin-like domain-containing protein, partial [Oleiphilus sp. HI0086]
IDGDVSADIGVSGSVDPNTIGAYTLSYNVSDSAGNAATTVVRTINVVDTGVPAITLLGDNPILHELQTTSTDPGATAIDAADGDLSSSIVITGSVDSNTAGTYTLSYDVTDSQSN